MKVGDLATWKTRITLKDHILDSLKTANDSGLSDFSRSPDPIPVAIEQVALIVHLDSGLTLWYALRNMKWYICCWFLQKAGIWSNESVSERRSRTFMVAEEIGRAHV